MAEEAVKKELEVLTASIGKEVEIQGKKITIRPYSWADTFRMAKPLSVVLNTIFTNYQVLGKALEHTNTGNVMMQLKVLTDFFSAIDDTEGIIEALTVLLAAGAREDEAFIRELDPADAFILGRAIFEANKDFFTKKAALLLPKGKKKAGK